MTLFIKVKRSFDPLTKRWGYIAISDIDSSFSFREENAVKILLERNPEYKNFFIERYSIFSK
jgi:hypothetical protein